MFITLSQTSYKVSTKGSLNTLKKIAFIQSSGVTQVKKCCSQTTSKNSAELRGFPVGFTARHTAGAIQTAQGTGLTGTVQRHRQHIPSSSGRCPRGLLRCPCLLIRCPSHDWLLAAVTTQHVLQSLLPRRSHTLRNQSVWNNCSQDLHGDLLKTCYLQIRHGLSHCLNSIKWNVRIKRNAKCLQSHPNTIWSLPPPFT